jgi:hypothetical protein
VPTTPIRTKHVGAAFQFRRFPLNCELGWLRAGPFFSTMPLKLWRFRRNGVAHNPPSDGVGHSQGRGSRSPGRRRMSAIEGISDVKYFTASISPFDPVRTLQRASAIDGSWRRSAQSSVMPLAWIAFPHFAISLSKYFCKYSDDRSSGGTRSAPILCVCVCTIGSSIAAIVAA